MKNRNVSICGSIGVGKSYILKKLRDVFNDEEKLADYENLKQYHSNFKILFEVPDENILNRYYKFFNRYYYHLFLLLKSVIGVYLVISYLLFEYIEWFGVVCCLLVWVFQEIGLFTKPKNLCFETQIYFLTLRLKSMLSKKMCSNTLLFDDRSWEEDKLFALLQHKQKYFTGYQMDIYNDLFENFSKFMGPTDVYIYIESSPKRSHENVIKRGSCNISLEYLKELHEVYKDWVIKMQNIHKGRFIVINNENNNLNVERILTVLNKNFCEEVINEEDINEEAPYEYFQDGDITENIKELNEAREEIQYGDEEEECEEEYFTERDIKEMQEL